VLEIARPLWYEARERSCLNETSAGRIGDLVARPTVIELLALPGWQTSPTSLDAWVERLTALAGPVVVTREATDASWLEIGRLRLRGYAVLAGRNVEAINFELSDPDPAAATQAITAAAEALGWEVHDDDEADDDDDDDEHDEET
jgi:hypothetical protein